MIKCADLYDIDTLIEMRLGYIKETQTLTLQQKETLEIHLYDYFKCHLNKDIYCLLMMIDDICVSSAYLLVVDKPCSIEMPNGRTGTILNVYTKHDYRHRGYAKEVIKALLDEAKQKHLDYIELKATNEGYSLYKKLGFKDDDHYKHMIK